MKRNQFGFPGSRRADAVKVWIEDHRRQIDVAVSLVAGTIIGVVLCLLIMSMRYVS